MHRRRPKRVRGLNRLRGLLPSSTWAAVEARRQRWFDDRFLGDRAARRVLNAYQYYRAFRTLGLQFDVVESPGASLELFFGLFRPAALVVHLHTPAGFELALEREHPGWRARLANEIDRTSANRANVLTSGSRMMVQTLRNNGWLDSVEPMVVPLTMDTAPWSVIPSVKDTAPVVLTIGRLEFRKAPEVLVERE